MIFERTHIYRLIYNRFVYIDYFIDMRIDLINYQITFTRYCVAKHRIKKLIYECMAPIFKEITFEN